MKKVYIEPGCISCGTCQFLCPQVFKVTDIAQVRANANVEKYKELIKEAADACPVSVVQYKE